MGGVIKEGDQVLLKRDKTSGVFQVRSKRQIHFDKAKFMLNGIIGEPFGAVFKVKDGHMVRIADPDQVLNEMMEAESQAGKDNRDLVAGDNQKLTQEDIIRMKEEGKSGEEIIQELVCHSETFEDKTEFSQRKYLKKKLKKHVFIFKALKPTARLLAEMVYLKNPDKICHMRIDSLSQILTYANIMSGVKVAIVDTLQGLVVGSVMERMGGLGEVVQFYPGSNLNRHLVDFFDFPLHFKEKLHSYALQNLPALRTVQSSVSENKMDTDEQTSDLEDTKDKGDNSKDSDTDDSKKDNSRTCDTNTDGSECATETDVNKVNTPKKRRKEEQSETEDKRAEKCRAQEQTKHLIQQKNFDCLIVACKYHPTPIVLTLLQFVSPSRPVVVYSAHKEPLMDCYTQLKTGGKVLNLRLTETWFREYQVLPARTHPEMQMNGTGGYILTCTTVTD